MGALPGAQTATPTECKESTMAESDWEQLAYGNHCKHGTAIGTPGGADFMCGLCEMGFDVWVPEPTFQLGVWISPDQDVPIEVGTYLEFGLEAQERALAKAIGFSELALNHEWPIVFEARQIASGYWAEENPYLGDWDETPNPSPWPAEGGYNAGIES